MKHKPLPPIKELQQIFVVDSTSPSGLRWNNPPHKRVKQGEVAGSIRTKDNYWRVRWTANGKQHEYLAHRIVYALQNQVDPGSLIVDHVLNDKDNTKPLRLATNLQNCQNRNGRSNTSSKYKGVSYIKETQRWRAVIVIDKQYTHIGVYNTEQEAAIAYNNAALLNFGEFARLNQIN